MENAFETQRYGSGYLKETLIMRGTRGKELRTKIDNYENSFAKLTKENAMLGILMKMEITSLLQKGQRYAG